MTAAITNVGANPDTEELDDAWFARPDRLDLIDLDEMLPILSNDTTYEFSGGSSRTDAIVRINVNSPGTYNIELDSDADLVASLYDIEGDHIETDDDSGGGLNPRLDASLLADQDYYLRVSHYEENVSLPKFSAKLSVEN